MCIHGRNKREGMMKRCIFTFVLVWGLLLTACAPPTAEVIEKTVEVTQVVETVVTATPEKPEAPASVDKLTVVVDGWGTDDLCPVSMSGDNFVQDYFNPLLLDRNENNEIVPYLAVNWEVSDEGILFELHPDARWHDGSPITADDVKWNIEAQSGKFPEYIGTTDAGQLAEAISEIEIIDEKTLFIKTVKPNAFLFDIISGTGYHSHHFGNPGVIREVGCPEVNETGSGGGGPYMVKEWYPGERVVLERWDDFWGDTDFLQSPQPKTIEIIRVPDGSARFAMLQSGEADVVVNIPYHLAAQLPLSDEYAARGMNPGLGSPWIQLIEGAGNMSITFPTLWAIKDSPNKPTEEELKPFDDIRVREAMELAVDKKAISEDVLYGFTKPMSSIYFSGGVGYRPELEVSPYDPERAAELLQEAGYADGFSADLYYGPFPNTPGLKEWLETAASYWKEIGIEVDLHEVVAEEFYKRYGLGQGLGERERAWRPLAVQTWGRFNESANLANFGYHSDGSYVCCYDDSTDELVAQIVETTDAGERAELLHQLEDHILDEQWLIPMDEKAIVVGYSDRVLEHPTAPFASSWEQMWRVVLRD
jgi:peptide/nickel transport system substrate-binding protein